MAVREYYNKSLGQNTYFWNHYPAGREGKRLNTPLPLWISSMAEAEEYVAANLQQQGLDEVPDEGSTIAELWSSYLSHIKREKRPRTAEDVEDAGNSLCKVLGDLPPKYLDKGYLNLFKDLRLSDTVGKYMKRPISKRTINKDLSWLSGFLKWCADNGIETPKGLTITRFKYKRPIPIVLSIEEALKIILAAEPLYRSFFGCLYLGGMRFEEAQLLKREDIDDGNSRALVTGKGNKQRLIPLPPFLLAWIDEIKPKGSTGYVHTQSRNPGKPIWPPKTALDRAAKKAGVTKHVYPHLMRHCFASHALTEWGTDIKTLQRYLGHANLQATEWYIHTSEANVTRAAQSMTDSLAPIIARFSTSTSSNNTGNDLPFSTG